MTFGKFIKNKRKEAKINVQDFARALGYNARTLESSRVIISRLENGKRDFSFDKLWLLAGVFDMRLSELIAEYENSN